MHRYILCLPMAVFVMACPSVSRGDIAIEFTFTGENGPLTNVPVQLIPNSGDDAVTNHTDKDGRVKFGFKSCKFVNVWIDTPQGNAVDIPAMCGDFNQRTSVYIQGMAYGHPLTDAYRIEKLLGDLRTRYGDGHVPIRVARDLRRMNIRGQIESATTSDKEDDEEMRKEKSEVRDKLLSKLARLTPNPLD